MSKRPDEDDVYEKYRQQDIDDGVPHPALNEALRDIATTKVVDSEVRQPKYVKPSMTVEAAARQAQMRGCYLKTYWDSTLGLRVVAVRKERA